MLSRVKKINNLKTCKALRIYYDNTFLGLGEIDNEKEEIRVLRIFNNRIN